MNFEEIRRFRISLAPNIRNEINMLKQQRIYLDEFSKMEE
jgi:hypothetical protein